MKRIEWGKIFMAIGSALCRLLIWLLAFCVYVVTSCAEILLRELNKKLKEYIRPKKQ